MGSIGAWEIALVVLVVLLVFGPKKLPEMGRSLGRGMREFKESVGDTAKELKDATADTPAALREGFNPKRDLKAALNPFSEEDHTELAEATAVDPGGKAPAAAPVPEEAAGAERGAATTSEEAVNAEDPPSSPSEPAESGETADEPVPAERA